MVSLIDGQAKVLGVMMRFLSVLLFFSAIGTLGFAQSSLPQIEPAPTEAEETEDAADGTTDADTDDATQDDAEVKPKSVKAPAPPAPTDSDDIEIIEEIVYDADGNIIERIYTNQFGEVINPADYGIVVEQAATAPDAEGLADDLIFGTNFEGGYFKVDVPLGFSINPSLASSKDGAYDSVVLRSPDGGAEFYVFAPERGGVASDIILDTSSEQIVDETVGEDQSRFVNSWWSISAIDESYIRSYHSRIEVATERLTVFGLRYRSKDDFNAYIDLYREFKKSFEYLDR